MIYDLSVITTIDEKKLEKFVDLEECCIANCIKDREDGIAVIDIGIGTLSVLVENDTINYKFIPSESLSKKILTSLNGKSSVADRIEKIARRVTLDAYKDVMG